MDIKRRIAYVCGIRLKLYRVSYFNSKHKWVTDKVEAYTRNGAVRNLNKEKGLKLRAGRNCFVSHVVGGRLNGD